LIEVFPLCVLPFTFLPISRPGPVSDVRLGSVGVLCARGRWRRLADLVFGWCDSCSSWSYKLGFVSSRISFSFWFVFVVYLAVKHMRRQCYTDTRTLRFIILLLFLCPSTMRNEWHCSSLIYFVRFRHMQ
jgi:hypothetical protein